MFDLKNKLESLIEISKEIVKNDDISIAEDFDKLNDLFKEDNISNNIDNSLEYLEKILGRDYSLALLDIKSSFKEKKTEHFSKRSKKHNRNVMLENRKNNLIKEINENWSQESDSVKIRLVEANLILNNRKGNKVLKELLELSSKTFKGVSIQHFGEQEFSNNFISYNKYLIKLDSFVIKATDKDFENFLRFHNNNMKAFIDERNTYFPYLENHTNYKNFTYFDNRLINLRNFELNK